MSTTYFFDKKLVNFFFNFSSEKRHFYSRKISSILYIRITCPCNEDPLTLHFYILKLGFTEVFIFFLSLRKLLRIDSVISVHLY